MRHSFIATEQSIYIKKIKDEANEDDAIIVHVDFAENHSLLNQNAIMQAHWSTQQASIFTIHLKVSRERYHSMAIISNNLTHDVQFVHAAQAIISDYVQSIYPAAKRLIYVSDGAPHHFKNNKNILNLTYHRSDFGIPASWSFCATAHGKGAVDGIGAAIKYRATKRVLSGNSTDAILTPYDLFKFAQKDTTVNVFYLDTTTIERNAKHYGLIDRWRRIGNESKEFDLFYRVSLFIMVTLGWVNQIRSQHQFDPIVIGKIDTRRTSSSSLLQTCVLDNPRI